jgi:hypothetical protein
MYIQGYLQGSENGRVVTIVGKDELKITFFNSQPTLLLGQKQ